MKHESIIISLMFFLSSCIYIYLGIRIILKNPKERVSKAFLALAGALFIWSFSYALNNLAKDMETALFWRRVGSVGRIYLFAIILHFMFLLTEKRDDFIEKWIMQFIYIPTLILVYVFSISSTMAPMQYNLMQVNYGWVDKPVDNIWTRAFFLYFISYMSISLGVVLRWKEKLKDKIVNKQANLIISTIVIAVGFGWLLDIIPSLFLEKPLPQLTSIVILIPVFAMYYAASYYNLFKAETFIKEEIIINSEDQENVFKNLSLSFYVAAILAFISEYIPYIGEDHALKYALLKALIISSIGFIIGIVQYIKKEEIRNNLTKVVLLLSIPICLFLFLKYASVTVWAFPIIIIISSILFTKRGLLVSTTIISIITQILIWIFRPEVRVVVDKYDYILRIGMYSVAFFTALYTNKIYVSKIKENKNQVKFQMIISDILFDFLDLNQTNFDYKVNSLLKNIGVFFHVDRIYLFTIDSDNTTMTYSNEWCNKGIKEEVGTIEEIPLSVFPWWMKELKENRLVYIEDTDEMPRQASNEQEQLRRQEVKSLVSVPIIVEDNIVAFIGIDSILKNKIWSSENINMLNIMANILSNGFIKINSEKEIEFMAYYDNLTGLANRALFQDRVNHAISLAERNEKCISIMFMDLDDFKSVNDTMGHDGGDHLLKEVSNRLSKTIRKTDTLARFGGDEFVILLNNIDKHSDILNIADNIMGVFSRPFTIKGQEFFITSSCGIAIYPMDGEDSKTLVKNADMAMYEAKNTGKNQYFLCSSYTQEEVEKSTKLSNDLYRALERNELSIHYQPQVNLINKEISGFEALLRWNHPEYGMISPGVFIPLAEKNGLINNIGEWVLKTACNQNKSWQKRGFKHLQMAVNLSAVQFMNENIARDIERILLETKLDPKYLELEITESIAIKETDYVINVLNKLKKIGVSIAIDDFGTQYSSLSRLKILPIDRIKIDIEFIHGIEKNEKDQAITRVIINLAKSLGMDVIAEGVETAPQLKFLKEKVCDYVQGYYFYKPMPADEIEKILKKFNALDESKATETEHVVKTRLVGNDLS